jgi:hypothetical protein
MRDRSIVIVTARCSRSKQCFGIRLERQAAGHWAATWSFALKESVAKREGYDKFQISGLFSLLADYPGCPHCQGRGFFLCGRCSKVGCWNGEGRSVICPWCGQPGELAGEISSLESGADR